MRGDVSIERRRSDDPLADEALRFLDRPVAREPAEDALGVAPLIRGIDRFDRLRAWDAIERRLGRGPGSGRRPVVAELLDEREATLDEIGERPERLPLGPFQSHAEREAGAPSLTAAEARERSQSSVATVDDDQVVADAFATDRGEQA